MARKKKVKKKITKRVKKNSKNLKLSNIKKKIPLVINNLSLFVILSIVSFILYKFAQTFIQNDFLTDLFFIMVIIFGFVAVGFFIVLLVLSIIKVASKK